MGEAVMHAEFYLEILKREDNLEDFGLNGMIYT
jgi:hypothetical protein